MIVRKKYIFSKNLKEIQTLKKWMHKKNKENEINKNRVFNDWNIPEVVPLVR